jgi:hypothetical protein
MATLSNTLQFGTSLKSWNTTPMLRRSAGTADPVKRAMSRPRNRMRPSSVISVRWMRRSSVLLPDAARAP